MSMWQKTVSLGMPPAELSEFCVTTITTNNNNNNNNQMETTLGKITPFCSPYLKDYSGFSSSNSMDRKTILIIQGTFLF